MADKIIGFLVIIFLIRYFLGTNPLGFILTIIVIFAVINFYFFIKTKIDDKIAEETVAAGFSKNMSGEEYEEFCKYILKQRGWRINLTPKSGDQGVDLIAFKEYLKVCIQCKRYTNPVGNKAVQEIIAGKQFYDGTHAVVVTNAGYTKSAQTLALKTGVILISHNQIGNLEDYLN